MKNTPLKSGDTIGIISPAGCVKEPLKLEKAICFLQKNGFEILLSPNVLACEDYFAGNDDLRLADLHWAFENPDVNAVLCSRGGYGCARLLDKIDYDLIAKNPKPIFGYSDVTVLLNNLPCPTFHAPMAVGDFGADEVDELTWECFLDMLTIRAPYFFEAIPGGDLINPGIATGGLMGGNLSVMASLLGTPYFPDLTGKILLVEDLNEDMYKIDRMLTQLRLAGVFEKVSGVVFAGFGSTQVSASFLKQFLPETVPAFMGFYASHEQSKYTLPFKVEYSLNADRGALTLLENVFDSDEM